jgi:hypothetical protein
MSIDYKDYCKKSIGNFVEIHDKSGKIVKGKIEKIDEDNVYIKEFKEKDLGGNGYGFFNPLPGAFFNPFIFRPFLTPILLRSIIGFRPFTPFF